MRAPKQIFIPAAALALLGAALLVGCSGSHNGGGGYPPAAVKVVTLRAQSLTLTRELPGHTSAFLVAEVRPQVTGIVNRRLFTEGGAVQAGQVLYELDDRTYQAQYDGAAAALKNAQATLEAAQFRERRSAELRKIDAVSAQDNETTVAELRQAEAGVASAEAAVASARVNLGFTRITSPITGRIGKSSVTQGALVTANQTQALATVQKLDPIYVDVSQSSGEWLALKQDIVAGKLRAGGAGTPAKILLENGSDYGAEGTLQFEDVTIDEATGSLLLRILVPNPTRTLLPGMYVKAIISQGVRPDALLAPQIGLTRDASGQATALIVGAGNKVEPRVVRVSRAIGDQWLVEDGLHVGDRLIVEGLQKVQPGMPVEPSEAGSAPPPAAAAPAAPPAAP
jgi:membrane fusion protein (multidrug efflux system)